MNDDYFNSGLMHMHLNHPSLCNLAERSVDLVDGGMFKPCFADQCVLNELLSGNINLLPSRYNMFFHSNAQAISWKGDSNLHFIASDKPFQPNGTQWSFAGRNLIFEMLLNDTVDLDNFIAKHRPRLLDKTYRKHLLKVARNKIKNPPKARRLMLENSISEDQFMNLHETLAGYIAKCNH